MDTHKRKEIIWSVVAVVVVLAAIGGYYYFSNTQTTESDIQSAIDAANSITESATQGVLPSLGEVTNPLNNKPDINPTSKTNPFQ